VVDGEMIEDLVVSYFLYPTYKKNTIEQARSLARERGQNLHQLMVELLEKYVHEKEDECRDSIKQHRSLDELISELNHEVQECN
jgi:EAL domain-containing protein (putative c-di-GMP-specific phosphodiesterase class I)